MLAAFDVHSYGMLVLGPDGFRNDLVPDHERVMEVGKVVGEGMGRPNKRNYLVGTGDVEENSYLVGGMVQDAWRKEGITPLSYTLELFPRYGSCPQCVDPGDYYGFWPKPREIRKSCADLAAGVGDLLRFFAAEESRGAGLRV